MARHESVAVMAAIAVAALLSVVSAQVDTTNVSYPVVPVPEACYASCSAFPAMVESACVFCLGGAGAVYGFNTTYQPPVQRLPFYETGFRNIPAFIVSFPASDALVGLYAQRDGTLNSLWANRSQTTARVCFPPDSTNCTVRTMAPTMRLFPNGTLPGPDALSCIEKAGWLTPVIPPAQYSQACSDAPNLTLQNQNFSSPGSLAGMFPSTRGIIQAQKEAVAYANAFFNSVTAAADSLWRVSNAAHTLLFHFHNISTRADLNRIRRLYGADFQPYWNTLYNQGDLVEFDMTWLEGITSKKWNVAPHAVMQYVKLPTGNVTLRAIAVRLSNIQSNPTAYQVYTARKSRSAFIQALVAARSAIAFSAIYVGHVYTQHIIQSSAAYALYNSIDVGVLLGQSSHPVRILSDMYTYHGFLGIFNVGLYVGGYPPPIHCLIDNDAAILPTVYEKYAVNGSLPGNNSFWNSQIEQILTRSGLHPAKFTAEKAWDLYPAARYQVELKNLTNQFVYPFLYGMIPNDTAVEYDPQVQMWAAQMIDPRGGNVLQLNRRNQIKTREELATVVSHMVWLTLVHIGATTPDYTARQWSAAWLPFCTNMNELFDPYGTYSVPTMVANTINAYTYSQQNTFNAFYQVALNPLYPLWVPYKCADGSASCPQMVESNIPVWDAMLPFNSTLVAAVPALGQLNALVVGFRQGFANFMANNRYCRAMETNLTNPDVFAVMTLNYIIN